MNVNTTNKVKELTIKYVGNSDTPYQTKMRKQFMEFATELLTSEIKPFTNHNWGKEFKKGQVTKEVWSGELISECEYLDDLGQGRMLFYDRTSKCFRCVYWEYVELAGKFGLNGWTCAKSPSEFVRL